MEILYQCASCGQTNEVFLELVHGPDQQLVEDCAVCCRPMVIKAKWNGFTETFEVQVYQEDRD